MQALCLAKLLLTAGERLIVGSAVSSQGFVCSLTPGMYVMTREGRAIHIQHNMHTQTHTRHTYCGMQRREHVQEDNKPCLLLFLRTYVVKQQNTFYPNLPQITSNIPPWIDSLYFVISVMYCTLFSLKGVSKKKIHPLAVYYSFGYWRWFPQRWRMNGNTNEHIWLSNDYKNI